MNKRALCTQCLRPVKTCICKHIQAVENLVPVVILQHPMETREAKNSGRMLHLCLKNSHIIVGETFDRDFIASWLSGEFCDTLLYPGETERSLPISAYANHSEHLNSTELVPAKLSKPKVRLWVLDATWRKSRKMLHLNPFLHAMPRLNLDECPASMYTIRKAHKENQLSTLEASCYALQQLEANRVDYAPVLNAFAAFVAEQHTFLPSSK